MAKKTQRKIILDIDRDIDDFYFLIHAINKKHNGVQLVDCRKKNNQNKTKEQESYEK